MAILISEALRQKALAEGLDQMRIGPVWLATETSEHLQTFLIQGRHGDMDWMAQNAERRANPQRLWPSAKTCLVFALSYAQDLNLETRLANQSTGTISTYALHRDYHDLFKGKLKRLGHWLAHETQAEVKVFVDTAPVMEKPLAQQAGLGWQGKHSNLVSRELGSWFFIGVMLTTAELAINGQESDHCGSCRACLDACPTQAFPAPYQLDARRCISYLTIEHRGTIPLEFRRAMGNRIYGCDDCLAACPWNKFAVMSREAKLQARADLISPSLADLVSFDDQAFRQHFSGSPIKRTGRERFIRNVLVAIGNSNDPQLVESVLPCLADASPLVRAMAVWALNCLSPSRFTKERSNRRDREKHAEVIREWDRL